MHETSTTSSNFYSALSREDAWIDGMLFSIRRRQDTGELDARAAATARVHALERHLTAVTDLQVRYGLVPVITLVDEQEDAR